MIENFINEIVVEKSCNIVTGDVKLNYIFYGDGKADFEKRYHDAPKEIVEDYIQSCYNQIELAKKYLNQL